MQIGIVGLGRMGANIARRLRRGGHDIVAFDVNSEAVAGLAREGMKPARSLKELVELLTPPRVVWVMLPAGKITENSIDSLAALMASGDTVIDGGNTFYKDDIRRAAALRPSASTAMENSRISSDSPSK